MFRRISAANRRVGLRCLCLALASTASACGSGGQTVAGAAVPSRPPIASGAAAMLTITVPARGVQYVSSATRSLSATLISVDGSAPSPAAAPAVVAIGTTAPGCTSAAGAITCTAAIAAPAGNDVFRVATFASTDASGTALSVATTAATAIVPNGVNTIAVALSGVVANVQISLAPIAVPTGTPATIAVSVAALDPAGATIVGATAYDRTITLTNSDTSGAFTLSTTTVTAPTTAVTLRYTGASVAGPVSIGATAPSLASSAITPATISAGIGAVGAPVSVYDLGVSDSYRPSTVGTDPSRFNAAIPGFGTGTPPPSALIASTSVYGGNGGAFYDLTKAGQSFDGTKVPSSCGCAVASTSTTSALREFVAVQTWPFYVGGGGSSNVGPGTFAARTESDDASWFVLGTAALTFAQAASVGNAAGLTAGTAWVNNNIIAPPTTETGTVTIAAAATGATTPAANLYWITLEYAELVGGQAVLDYAWKPPGAMAYGQVTQAVVYGRVTRAGAPVAGTTVTVGDPAGGTHALVSDANGFYGYNYPPFVPQNITVSVAGAPAQSGSLAPGRALRLDVAL